MKDIKVLIIEDNEAITRSLKYTLEEEGFTVAVANHSSDGIADAKNEDPDIIMLDIIMPEFSGYEVLEKVKNNLGDKQVPIVIFSNLDRPEDKVLIDEMGAVDFISKSDVDGKKIALKLKQILQTSD